MSEAKRFDILLRDGCDGEVVYNGPIWLDEDGCGTVVSTTCATCGGEHTVEYTPEILSETP